MKKTLFALLMLSLALTGCIVEPGGGWGWHGGGHGEYHQDRGWGR